MTEEARAQFLISWLDVLNNGYVKPDVKTGAGNATGVVRDTKDFFPYIDNINKEICSLLEVDQPDLTEVISRRDKTSYNK